MCARERVCVYICSTINRVRFVTVGRFLLRHFTVAWSNFYVYFYVQPYDRWSKRSLCAIQQAAAKNKKKINSAHKQHGGMDTMSNNSNNIITSTHKKKHTLHYSIWFVRSHANWYARIRVRMSLSSFLNFLVYFSCVARHTVPPSSHYTNRKRMNMK